MVVAREAGSIDGPPGGDLVPQGREEPNGWSQASFDRNEGEIARCAQPGIQCQAAREARVLSRAGKEASSARTRARRGAEALSGGAGAADCDVSSASSYLQLTR